jgi:integrase
VRDLALGSLIHPARPHLSKQVVSPRLYALEKVPRSVPWNEVERMLAEVDRRSTAGLRDYAMLTLMAVCGLRASEVAALRLGDIDWRRDVIRLRRPKTRSADILPLVPRVGEAIISYLRRRPTSSHEQVFLTLRAPIVPVSHSAVSLAACGRLIDTGVQGHRLGSHTLRHSHAMHLLRKGFTLKQIGDVLGHHRQQSTMVYTKAATEDLREVAQDIPAVAA